MKTLSKLDLIVALAAMGSAHCAQGQSYSINWFKVSGGGGTSVNAPFTLSGTIGQHDAGGPMKNGIYSLAGGFWTFAAVQTPGAPFLKIFLTNSTTAVVEWPAPSTGLMLQQNADLTTTNWVNVTNPTNVLGGLNQVSFPAATGNLFFRLANP
jgi:hypothetical protein